MATDSRSNKTQTLSEMFQELFAVIPAAAPSSDEALLNPLREQSLTNSLADTSPDFGTLVRVLEGLRSRLNLTADRNLDMSCDYCGGGVRDLVLGYNSIHGYISLLGSMWLEVIAAVVVGSAAYLYYYSKKAYRYFEERGVRNLPPIPIFGNFIKSTFRRTHMIDDIDHIYSSFPDDKYVGAFEAFTPITLVRDPEIIKKITVKDFDHFADHRDFFVSDFDPLFGCSLVFLKGQRWRDMRATLSPAFTSAKMRLMLPFMNEISRQVVAHLHQEMKPADQGKLSEEMDMFDLFSRYANDVIASCVFGHKVNSQDDKENLFFKMGRAMTQFTAFQKVRFFFVVSLPKIATALKIQLFPRMTTDFFRQLVSATMKYREDNSIYRPDMLQLLMEAQKGTLKHTASGASNSLGTVEPNIYDDSQKSQWTQDELAAQAFVFFFAGFESSSSALTMSVHELAVNPDVQKKLLEEIDNCHASNAELTYEVLQSLKYMDMVISETLRKWSTAILLSREVSKEYTLEPPRPGAQPVTLKPHEYVYVLVNALHMDPQYFPEPHRFDPERFSDERKHEIKPFTFLPFGVGPRNCIGSRFALMELKVMLYQLLLEFELVPCSRTTNPVRLQPLDFNVRVAGGSYLKLKARK